MADSNDVTAEKVELDLGSFNQAERRELQRRFDNQFQDLRLLVAGRVGYVDDKVAKLVDANGVSVFSDEVLSAMITIVRRRTNPDAKESDLDDLTFDELRGMFVTPKGRRTSNRSSKPKS